METWLDERLGRPKLLLVDDQPMNIRVLHQLFRYECDVHMATGGEQAIEVCKSLLPDLILLDVVMEGMDGHEVCRRLKADPLTQHIPIIFLSANGEEDDEADAGRTILFATHYLEEAEQFARRTVVMHHGRIVADAPTAQLRAGLGARTVSATLPDTNPQAALQELHDTPGVTDLRVDAKGFGRLGRFDDNLGQLIRRRLGHRSALGPCETNSDGIVCR